MFLFFYSLYLISKSYHALNVGIYIIIRIGNNRTDGSKSNIKTSFDSYTGVGDLVQRGPAGQRSGQQLRGSRQVH